MCRTVRVEKYTDIGDNQNIRKGMGDIMTASQILISQGIEQGKAMMRLHNE